MSRTPSLPSPARGSGAGVGRAAWIKGQKGRRAVLYVIRVYSADESFYKLGITFDLPRRFARLKTVYKWRTVARFSSWNAGAVFDLEQQLHAEFSALSYRPAASFSGFTECYNEVSPLLSALPASTFFLKNTETLI